MNIPTVKFIGILSSIFTAIMLAPASAASETLRQFAMYAKPALTDQNCELVERRFNDSEIRNVFSGKPGQHECNVSIQSEEYEQMFKFCFLSGINVHQIKNYGAFECFIQKQNNGYVFSAKIFQDGSPDSQIMCYFSCLSR